MSICTPKIKPLRRLHGLCHLTQPAEHKEGTRAAVAGSSSPLVIPYNGARACTASHRELAPAALTTPSAPGRARESLPLGRLLPTRPIYLVKHHFTKVL